MTNAFGMHDDPVTVEKPDGTIRIAVLGSSMDMGWGVRYQDTYINQLEEWLDFHAVRQGVSPPRRFEVLNFAVAAYSPMQRLETLRRKVLAFHPDLVIYSATTLDIRLMEIHLCDMLRKNVDLKYDFLHEATALAGVDDDDLRVDSEGTDAQQGSAQEQAAAVLLGPVRHDAGRDRGGVPGGGRAAGDGDHSPGGQGDAPSTRAEPVARLKAMAAHQGLTVFDLSDTFDQIDPATLEIAAWDDHPNAMGHRRLFLALARAMVKDQELYHLLFTPADGSRSPKTAPAAWNLSPTRIGEVLGGQFKRLSLPVRDAPLASKS